MCLFALAAGLLGPAPGQVYSPKVLLAGQPDSTDLRALANGIYAQAHAGTPGQRAEAIWRFFLTDGRFVQPGFWYHIAGWAYEEPAGEVLDPLKLLNSYGFGLCYQIAPLLEAVFEAGGFDDARVWFLTGHTVAEVFYEGSYHYYDSDMMGYNLFGTRVASVHDLERDGNIILSKLAHPEAVAIPWYPADVRAKAMPDLASLFTTTADNSLFPFTRYPQGHSMDFVLRPGERLIRYFQPETAGLYYLPHKFDGSTWQEFPQEIAAYQIRTQDGPRSQKDERRWGTGRIEYQPSLTDRGACDPRFTENVRFGEMLAPSDRERPARVVYEVRSPYVVIDGSLEARLELAGGQTMELQTSTDDGRSWLSAGVLRGPHKGIWSGEPALIFRSRHGRRTAVTGTYGYLVRLTFSGAVRGLKLSTRIQINPRTLPALVAGSNQLVYTASASQVRRSYFAEPRGADLVTNARFVAEGGQGFWAPVREGPADFLFRVESAGSQPLAGFDAGARFLDLRRGLAPDKFTAEVRRIRAGIVPAEPPAASLAWSTDPHGPFRTLWEFNPNLQWKGGQPIDRVLAWPEVDRRVSNLPRGIRRVFVRYRVQGMAIDQFRLAGIRALEPEPGGVILTHVWKQEGVEKRHSEQVWGDVREHRYRIGIPPGTSVSNEAVILECPPKKTRRAALPPLPLADRRTR